MTAPVIGGQFLGRLLSVVGLLASMITKLTVAIPNIITQPKIAVSGYSGDMVLPPIFGKVASNSGYILQTCVGDVSIMVAMRFNKDCFFCSRRGEQP